MRLRATGSSPTSSASNHASTSCSSATTHRPHFVRFVRFLHRFDAGNVTVSTDDHALCQLQVQADNFRNLFMYSPNGKKDGIQIIPLSEVAAKDEFLNIKNVSRDDMMAAHRVPPQMMGIIPNNTGGFGDVEKASRVFVRNELMPLQKRLQELNDWLGEEVIRFEPYTLGLTEDKRND